MLTRILPILFLTLFTSILRAQSTTPADKVISYTCVNKPLALVLSDLSAVSKVNIVYTPSKLNSRRLVTIQGRNEKLGDILNVILSSYRLSYEVIGDNIVIISERSEEFGLVITISGYIKDATSKETLPYATIGDPQQGVGAVANAQGYYSLTLPRKSYQLIASYIGYASDTLSTFLGEDKRRDFFLDVENKLNEVIILSTKSTLADEQNLSKERYNKNAIQNATYLAGEADVLQLIRQSSGVSTGADGLGGLSVRGGNYDQNLVLFDGVPMHHTGHAMGLVSAFNASAVQEATLHKSDFPTAYGGRLSSVLDIRTRDGNYQKLAGEVSLSTMASRVLLEGPIVKDKASFLISARRTFADPWIKAISDYQNNINGDEGSTSYNFYDINAKVNFKLGAKNKAYFTFYQGQDGLLNTSERSESIDTTFFFDRLDTDINWGNRLVSFHLNSELGPKAFSRLILYSSDWRYSHFHYDGYYINRKENITEIYNGRLQESGLNTLGGRYEVDYLPSNKWSMSFGIAFNKQVFMSLFNNENNIQSGGIYPAVVTKSELKSINSGVKNHNSEAVTYLQSDIKLARFTKLKLGVHSSMLFTQDKQYLSIQPRISFTAGQKSKFKASLSRMTQYNQILSSNQLGYPSDLWVSSTDRLRPADAWIGATGVVFRIGEKMEGGVEGFYKVFNDIISLNEGGNVPFGVENEIWEMFIPRGMGSSYGIELNLSKPIGSFKYDLNYTYSNSTRLFADLNNGNQYAYRFDRPHMANLNLVKNLGSKADVYINVAYATGNPVTIPSTEIVELTNTSGQSFLSVVYSEKNNFRLNDYNRVDLGFNFFTNYKFGQQKFSLGVYNILNSRNPLYIEIKRNKFNPSVFELVSVSILPILPSINYSLTF